MAKITTTSVTKIVISGLRYLDPISVYFEDFAPKKGKFTITCFGESWTHTWGAMWDGYSVKEFFLKCDKYYLGGKLYKGQSNVIDWENVPQWICMESIRRRKYDEFSKDEARAIFDYGKSITDEYLDESVWNLHSIPYYISDIWPDICCEVPMKTSDKLTYLYRIIDAIKEALAEKEV